MSYRRCRCVPFDPAYATSTTVPLRNSRSNVRFHDWRFCGFGPVESSPNELVTPLMPRRDAGNGFDAVTSVGLLPLTENVSVTVNGNVSLYSSMRYSELLP